MTVVNVLGPTFNRARFLAEAVSSVLSQTYTDFKLIIVGDGSAEDEDTVSVLKPFFKDERVRVFSLGGLSSKLRKML